MTEDMFAQYRVAMPVETYAARVNDVQLAHDFDGEGFWNEAGEWLSFVTHVPLGEQWQLSPGCTLWIASAAADGIQVLGPSGQARLRDRGVRLLPAAVPSRRGLPVRAVLARSVEETPRRREPLPFLRVVSGVVSRMFSEGGYQEMGYAIMGVVAGSGPVVNAEAVRRAIGHGLSGLSMVDASEVRVEVESVSDTQAGFLVEISVTGDAAGLPPAESHRTKKVALQWSQADGPPREWLVSSLAKQELIPGSEEWWD